MERIYKYPGDEPDGVEGYRYEWPQRIVSIKETETHTITVDEQDVFYKMKDGSERYAWTRKSTRKNQRFLCIGGPLNGQKVSSPGNEYVTYNCAETSRGYRKGTYLYSKVVYLHMSLMP